MHEQPKIINQINVNVVSVIPNVNNLNSAYKLLRHFSQMGYMSESKAILTFPPPPPPTVFFLSGSLMSATTLFGEGGWGCWGGKACFSLFEVSMVANILDSSLRVKCF